MSPEVSNSGNGHIYNLRMRRSDGPTVRKTRCTAVAIGVRNPSVLLCSMVIPKSSRGGSCPAPRVRRASAVHAAAYIVLNGVFIVSFPFPAGQWATNSPAPRLFSIRLRAHSSTSDSIQRTMRPLSRTGAGKHPSSDHR